MKNKKKFLIEEEQLIKSFKKEFYDLMDKAELQHPKKQKRIVFKYWKKGIRFCEEKGEATDWNTLDQLFDLLETLPKHRISKQQYESIVN